MRARARGRQAPRDPGETGGGAGIRSIGEQKWLLFAVVALGAFIIGYGSSTLAFRAADAPTDVTLVPDLREMTVDEAVDQLEDADLTLELGDSLANANAPAGTILAQSPLPGQEVSLGAAVRVIVSTGQPRLEVPDVVAMPVTLATRTLEAIGFQVVVEEVPGEGEPGRVVGMEPAAGSALPLPASVSLRVGADPLLIAMPGVIGMIEDDARSTLEAAGLSVTDVRYERSEFGQSNGVVDQDPAPGDSVPPGSDVRLRVTNPTGVAAGEFEARPRVFNERERDR